MKPVALLSAFNTATAATALSDLALARAFFIEMPEPPHRPDFKNLPGNGLANTDLYNHDAPQPLWTCHVLNRLALKVVPFDLPWDLRDGLFNGAYKHCWLEHESRNTRLVLDIYPWAALSGPLLIDATALPWHTIYTQRDDFPTQDHHATFRLELAVAEAAWKAAATR